MKGAGTKLKKTENGEESYELGGKIGQGRKGPDIGAESHDREEAKSNKRRH